MKDRIVDHISLEALRVFERCGREMNFSAAAREMLVTQAAVSRRIKQLEDSLGYDLFVRNGRQLSFTTRGKQLYLRVHDVLELLSSTLDTLSPTARREHVTIAAGNSISHLWLSARLRDFANLHPDVPVRVLSSDDLAETTRPGNDMAIIYCAGVHPGWTLTPLVREELLPVASPGYLERAGIETPPAELSPFEVSQLRLCDYDLATTRWLNLQSWFQHIPGGVTGIRPTVRYSTYMMALDAAIGDGGVTLGSRGLIASYLAAGDLVELTSQVLDTGFSYHLGVRDGVFRGESVARLHDFLLSHQNDRE